MNIPARPTTYKGIRMRSRLEATFAASLDEDGYDWLYEPRVYANEKGQYLPDFQLLTFDGRSVAFPTFFEVRPTVERAYAAMEAMPIIWDSEPEAWLFIVIPGELAFLSTRARPTWTVSR